MLNSKFEIEIVPKWNVKRYGIGGCDLSSTIEIVPKWNVKNIALYSLDDNPP